MKRLSTILFFVILAQYSLGQDSQFKIDNIKTEINQDIIFGQFLNENLGYYLTANNEFYQFNSSSLLLNLPNGFILEKFIFKSFSEGLLIGTMEEKDFENSKNSLRLLTTVTSNSSRYFDDVYSGHFLFPKPDTKVRIALFTQDQCDTWSVFQIKTNFNLTGLEILGNYYYISTYGADDHLDGDLLRLQFNANYVFYQECSVDRALSGMSNYDGKLIVYGNNMFGNKITLVPFWWSKKKKQKKKDFYKRKEILPSELLVFGIDDDSVITLDILAEKNIKTICHDNKNIYALDESGLLFHFQNNKFIGEKTQFIDVKQIQYINEQEIICLMKDGALKKFNFSENKFYAVNNLSSEKIKFTIERNNFIQLFGENGFIGMMTKVE